MTQIAALTTQFYDWERRGRGWSVWPLPVDLEPPYVPFLGHYAADDSDVIDDGRRHTLLSGFIETVKQKFATQRRALVQSDAEGIAEPDPDWYRDDSPLIEWQLAVPSSSKFTTETYLQFLANVAGTISPLAFEIIGTKASISIQLVCRNGDQSTVIPQITAHFPEVVISKRELWLQGLWRIDESASSLIVDFGLAQEFMRPLEGLTSRDLDPFMGMLAALSDLQGDEIAVFQILFQATRYAWAESVLRAVTDGKGHAFFLNDTTMLPLAREKIASPLHAVVIRAAAQSADERRSLDIVSQLAGSLNQFATPIGNELIPLANDEYDEDDHLADFLARVSRRSGMLLNSEELVSFVHLPAPAVRSAKLIRHEKKTKRAPDLAPGHSFVLGDNHHGGQAVTVTLSPDQRLRHTHLIGASGSGKSTLLLNSILQDLQQGNGFAVLDPHGDLIEAILGQVPTDRRDDVIVFDPADDEYAIGFNILSAHSTLEKNLLASDLVAVFRRLSTSWGDQMNSVLANAIIAILESSEGGTLTELRRFLVEPEFRRGYLETVRDEEIVYYWQREFPLLTGRPQGSILTRLDAFLRPKPIRHIVCQKDSKLDLSQVVNGKKIFLAKLAQGAIGEENAYLLGSFLVSKLQQVALARQEIKESDRQPFYLYLDEFHNFICPSMASILRGASKYKLGLILAHQELRQLGSRSDEVMQAVLSNPCTRICFRVGDDDARKLAEGFSTFEAKDLQNLAVGEAICRVEQAQHDFNLRIPLPPTVDAELATERRGYILEQSRQRFGKPRELIDLDLQNRSKTPVTSPPLKPAAIPLPPTPPAKKATIPVTLAPVAPLPPRDPGTEAKPILPALPATPGRGGQQHKYLQHLIKRWAERRGFRAAVEQTILDGLGCVDVAIEIGDKRLACEITVTTSAVHELGNVQKCLAAGFQVVAVVSGDKRALTKAKEYITDTLDGPLLDQVYFFTPEELFSYIENLSPPTKPSANGHRVKLQYRSVGETEATVRRQAIGNIMLKALRRMKGKDGDQGNQDNSRNGNGKT